MSTIDNHTIIIRNATGSDILGVQRLAEAVLRHQYDDVATSRLLQRVYSEDSLRRSIANQGVNFILALTDDEQIVGLCNFGSPIFDDCEDRKEIHRLFVHPDYVREGVGTRLLDAVADSLSEDVKVQRISVYINPDDDARYQFFTKHGFHHELVEDKDGEWYMEKTL